MERPQSGWSCKERFEGNSPRGSYSSNLTNVSQVGIHLTWVNLPGDSSNEDRLQVRKEVIRTQKYFGENCYHRIKCTATAFLAALM